MTTIEEAAANLREAVVAIASEAHRITKKGTYSMCDKLIAKVDSRYPDAVRDLGLAVLEEADVGFDEPLEGGGEANCGDCTWDSDPYALPCEKHSRRYNLRRRIEELE